MSIPLVQEATKDAINTSIIAIKRNIERINMLLGLVDNDSPDLSGFATKQELQDAVTELQPVDEVTVDNMQSVTSNAVAEKFNDSFDILQNLTIHKIWGRLSDYETKDITLAGGYTYLFINTHVFAIEIIMFSLYGGNITQAALLTGTQVTTITGIGENAIRLTSNGVCRGYIFKIGDTVGT